MSDPSAQNAEPLPTAEGWYVDSGGYMWALRDDEWLMYLPTKPQPRDLPRFRLKGFAPFTRMLPVRPVEGMLGRDLLAVPVPWPDSEPKEAPHV